MDKLRLQEAVSGHHLNPLQNNAEQKSIGDLSREVSFIVGSTASPGRLVSCFLEQSWPTLPPCLLVLMERRLQGGESTQEDYREVEWRRMTSGHLSDSFHKNGIMLVLSEIREGAGRFYQRI